MAQDSCVQLDSSLPFLSFASSATFTLAYPNTSHLQLTVDHAQALLCMVHNCEMWNSMSECRPNSRRLM